MTYSLIYNPNTPEETIEKNNLTLEQALEYIEQEKEVNPAAVVFPLENNQ